MHIDLYKKYMDVTLKINLFYYGITGALLSFYFSQNGNSPLIEYSLIMPILFSIVFAVIFIFGVITLDVSMEDIDILVEKLEMSHYVRIDALLYLLKGSVLLMLFSTIGLFYVLWSPDL
jgi:hypothetical protein